MQLDGALVSAHDDGDYAHMLTAPLIITTTDSRVRLSSRGARGAGRHAGEGPNRLD